MPSPLPTPVAAALGIVPTVLDGVRRLPGKAVQLPVYAVSHVLTTLGTARREYDALAERGERLVARLRGTSFDEVEDVVEDALQGTAFARPYDVVEDALEDAGEAVTQLVRTGTARARTAAGTATRAVGSGVDKAADSVQAAATRAADAGEATARATRESVEQAAGTAVGRAADAASAAADTVEDAAEKVAGTSSASPTPEPAAGQGPAAATPAAEAPKGEPTPAAPEATRSSVDTAASPETVEVVERISSTVGGEVLAHEDLPLPDYDHLTLGSLRGRMRSLDLPQLIQIRDYEKAHADRLPIVTMLDNRIAKLANDPTAPLSGSSPAAAATAPAKPKRAKGGSKVSPRTADQGVSDPAVAFGGLGGAGKPS